MCQRHSLFRRIRILDSTSFQLPPEIQGIYEGCAGPGVKIQLELTFRTLPTKIGRIFLHRCGMNP
ncbi:hypothetical protein GsuE55_27580 [Geobacillus subterraneus]|uniref:Transposase DDE domain-containing protein n=1 Tax=Geobacillus subterraneus TaxID=129338 RepID=A0A679FTF8_9BACL|nr:hypothetical protein GsuE55_27580 [Geobacillus subterraneus]